ncbi:MAG: TrmB family transcriptional regulator [Tepidiforma sp.]|nr:MAG: TrmB family transcriptional regulator [Tepidiforma sp.]
MTETLTPQLELLPPARRLLLLGLKQLGETDAESLSQVAFLSVPAVRAHLAGLARLGLVAISRKPEGPGRPRNRYALTPRAESLFPQGYARIANWLLEAAERDPAIRRPLFRSLVGARLRQAAETFDAPTPAGRVEQLTRALEQLGYYPLLETIPGSKWRLTLRHCPFIEVAREHPEVCAIEERIFQVALPGGRIERACSRAQGSPACTFLLQSFR